MLIVGAFCEETARLLGEISQERGECPERRRHMTEIAQMTTEQLVALLAEKGWDIFEDGEDHVWAMEDIDLTRSVTGGYCGVYRETYPAAFRTPTYVRWSLDLQARTA